MRSHALLAALAVVLFSLPAGAVDEPTSLTVGDLIADLDRWNGQRIAITGELVGDYSERGDVVWVQVNDDPFVDSPVAAGGDPVTSNTGVGARIPVEVFGSERLGPPGRHGRYGPVVTLVGVFRHNDPSLGGETYLDTEDLVMVRAASAYPVGGPDIWLPIGLVLVVLAIVIALRQRSRGTDRRRQP